MTSANLSHAKQNQSKRRLLIAGSDARNHEYYYPASHLGMFPALKYVQAFVKGRAFPL